MLRLMILFAISWLVMLFSLVVVLYASIIQLSAILSMAHEYYSRIIIEMFFTRILLEYMNLVLTTCCQPLTPRKDCFIILI